MPWFFCVICTLIWVTTRKQITEIKRNVNKCKLNMKNVKKWVKKGKKKDFWKYFLGFAMEILWNFKKTIAYKYEISYNNTIEVGKSVAKWSELVRKSQEFTKQAPKNTILKEKIKRKSWKAMKNTRENTERRQIRCCRVSLNIA